MVRFDKVNKGKDFIKVFWTAPMYLPYWYEQTTSCRYLCRHETYFLKEVRIDLLHTSSLTYDLHPGSVCLMKLIAFYNPASIDPGIMLLSHTLYESKLNTET